MEQLTTKPELFFRVQDGEPDECCIFAMNEAEDMGLYFQNNVDINREVKVTLIKGVRVKDESGNFEYTVKEIS
jgi:hypothetical protein